MSYPSVRRLLESVLWSLDAQVAPTVTDPWAASSLRSIKCILEHLIARSELDAVIMADEYADLASVIDQLQERMPDEALWPELQLRLASLKELLPSPSVTASLSDANGAMLEALDAIVHAVHRAADDSPSPEAAAARSILSEYFVRHTERERCLADPAFAGPWY
jgi:hypothetical protein